MSGNKGNRDLELEIFQRFAFIVKEKLTSVVDDTNNGGDKIKRLDTLYQGPEFNAEKRILNDMNNTSLGKGVLAGLGCFAFLRWSPRAVARILQRRAVVGGASQPVSPFRQSSGYKLDPVAPGGQLNAGRPGLFFRLIRLTLDTFCSVSVGAYASLYFIDKKKMMKQFADIPLVEGRSLLSEELCEDFTREFRKCDRRAWDTDHPALGGYPRDGDDGGNTDFQGTILGFVANCRRRAIYENEVRRESGAGRADGPVVVLSPGVPRDIEVGFDDLLEEDKSGGEEANVGMAEGDYFDTYFGKDKDQQD